MTREDFVEKILAAVEQHLNPTLARLAIEDRLRLRGRERFVDEVLSDVLRGVWQLIGSSLHDEAEQKARQCGCGKSREARSKPVEVKVLGTTVILPCTYFYCRDCHVGESPVRQWLGVEAGDTSLALQRALTDLTERMTFGDAVRSLKEQQGQEIDRTQAERITYRVGEQAEQYLAERRKAALAGLEVEHRTVGVEQLQLTADGGAIPVGELQRPTEAECSETTPRTAVRKLPKGTRTIQGREARLISVREPEKVTERVVDLHIAPYNQTEFTGERMLASAALAGLGDKTKIHGVFDMGNWIHSQFEEQFGTYDHTACADICHVTGYLTEAGRQIVGQERAAAFGMENKRRMLDGEADEVAKGLARHRCDGNCLTDEHETCVVRATSRYLGNHRKYLDYPPILERKLPVGSGEAESGIRHLIKKRLDVAGAWDEKNAQRMLALIAVRASGWWDDFWRWRDRKDVEAWRRRQRGEQCTRFRGVARGRTPSAESLPS